MSSPNDQIFQLLGMEADEAFFIYTPATRRLDYVSPAFSKLVALPVDEIIDQHNRLMELVHPDDKDYLEAQLAGFKQGRKLSAEIKLIVNGEEKYVELTAYRLHNQQEMVAGWVTDISNIKKNIQYAEKINARKNSLLEILSHDLKEPVGMINMMASAIKNSPAVAGNQELESYIRVIQQLCDNNIRLIRNLVHDEFLEAQEISLRLERADLVWNVYDVVQQYQTSGSLIGKEFYFHCKYDQLFILMDTLKIIQVFNNLVSNAIKFTPDGGRIDVTITDLGESVRLTVSDNGIGVPEASQPFLFEPHTRAQRPGLRGEPGTGMGLSIIRTLTELHGGRVWLDTRHQTGTTFHIELPKGNTPASG